MSNIIKSNYVIIKNPVDDTKKIYPVKPLVLSTDEERDSILYEANAEKEKIIDEALAKAKEIIDSANDYKKEIQSTIIKDAEEAKEKGYKKGYDEGIIKGTSFGKKNGFDTAQAEVKSQNEELVSELCKQIYLVEESKDEIIKKFQNDIIKLSINIAEKITRTKISKDESIVKNILLNAISDYKNVAWMKIYLSSNDYITISTDKSIIEKMSSISEQVKLEVTNDAEDGDILIETPETLVDAGINTQIENLKSIVFGK